MRKMMESYSSTPRNNVVFERFKFFNCSRKEHQTVDMYIKELKTLAATCAFREQESSLIRDKFIGDIREKSLLSCLLSDTHLTLKRAVEIVRVWEAMNLTETARPSSVMEIKIEKESLTVLEFSVPGNTSEDRRFRKFDSSYNRVHKTSDYVVELLSKNNTTEKNIVHSKKEFKEDMKIHSIFRSTKADYKENRFKKKDVTRNMYDKGHLACAANYPNDEEARKETSILSIIVPQNSKCNSGIWKRLEEYVHELLQTNQFVTVCSGPLYKPRDIDVDKLNECCLKLLYGNNYDYVKEGLSGIKKFMLHDMTGNISVPTHFFKVIISENENSDPVKEGYIIENAPGSYSSFEKVPEKYKASVTEIEELSGYILTLDSIKEKADQLKKELQENITVEYCETDISDEDIDILQNRSWVDELGQNFSKWEI